MIYVAGGLILLGLGVVLYLTGRFHERRAMQDWRVLLTPEGQRLYEQQREGAEREMAVVDLALTAATETGPVASSDQAVRILEAGFGLIGHYAQSMRSLLAGMAVYSRMVSAMMPLPPVSPRRFRLRQLVSAASLAALVHHLLVTTAERYRLRVYTLRFGFGTVLRYLRRPGATPVDLATVGDARHDLRALTDESFESLRALLISLTHQPRG